MIWLKLTCREGGWGGGPQPPAVVRTDSAPKAPSQFEHEQTNDRGTKPKNFFFKKVFAELFLKSDPFPRLPLHRKTIIYQQIKEES